MTLTIGVDIGGTKVLGGVVTPAGEVIAQARRETPADSPAETYQRLAEVIKELAAVHPVEAVGVGAAGWIDVARANVLFAPNLAWRNEPLRDRLAALVGLPVVVENDANAAAWAEFQFGAARDAMDSMLLCTVGTGIGGGIVVNGQVLRGAHGIAAEFGHALMVPDGYPCGCGRRGCVEQYCSGKALARFARLGAIDQPQDALRLLELAAGVPDAITGAMVMTAARDGDLVARAAFDQVGHWLGIALADLVQILDPRVIVIGGGVVHSGDLLLAPARRGFERALAQRGRLPVAEVRGALLGNLAGVVGAADLARRG